MHRVAIQLAICIHLCWENEFNMQPWSVYTKTSPSSLLLILSLYHSQWDALGRFSGLWYMDSKYRKFILMLLSQLYPHTSPPKANFWMNFIVVNMPYYSLHSWARDKQLLTWVDSFIVIHCEMIHVMYNRVSVMVYVANSWCNNWCV